MAAQTAFGWEYFIGLNKLVFPKKIDQFDQHLVVLLKSEKRRNSKAVLFVVQKHLTLQTDLSGKCLNHKFPGIRSHEVYINGESVDWLTDKLSLNSGDVIFCIVKHVKDV